MAHADALTRVIPAYKCWQFLDNGTYTPPTCGPDTMSSIQEKGIELWPEVSVSKNSMLSGTWKPALSPNGTLGATMRKWGWHGVVIDFEEVNAYGQTRTPEYLAKFPTNLAPAVEHDGCCVSETNAIARYLCAAFPDKAGKFYPGDAKTKAKVDLIAEYTGITIYALIAKAMYPNVGFPLAAGDVGSFDALKEHLPASQEAAAAELLNLLNDKYVNNWLKNSTYLAGDEPTIADFRFAPIMYFASVAIVLPERIVKYLEDLETKVPGFKEATEGPRGFTADKVKA